jgi:hypothetical protein
VWNTVWVTLAYSVTVFVNAPGTIAWDGPACGPGAEETVSVDGGMSVRGCLLVTTAKVV